LAETRNTETAEDDLGIVDSPGHTAGIKAQGVLVRTGDVRHRSALLAHEVMVEGGRGFVPGCPGPGIGSHRETYRDKVIEHIEDSGPRHRGLVRNHCGQNLVCSRMAGQPIEGAQNSNAGLSNSQARVTETLS
jgi:hypothetical protein